MRFVSVKTYRTALLAALSTMLLGAAPVADAAKPATTPARGAADNALAPQSLQWQARGEAQMAKGELAAATDSFEAALVADPRNRHAYVGIARIAEAQGLPGKAVRFYREALELEPNDLDILELQGKALLMRGAKARAEVNLERLRKLCAQPCPQGDRLAAAVTHAPRLASQSAPADAPTNPAAVAAAEKSEKETPATNAPAIEEEVQE